MRSGTRGFWASLLAGSGDSSFPSPGGGGGAVVAAHAEFDFVAAPPSDHEEVEDVDEPAVAATHFVTLHHGAHDVAAVLLLVFHGPWSLPGSLSFVSSSSAM